MKYITGIHALNLTCSLDTCGDWHQSALRWKDITFGETSESIFGNYGIETNSHVPDNPGTYVTANHIRALLDLLETNNLKVAQGMNNDFICNDIYDLEIFDQVSKLCNLPHWDKIDEFMGREYYSKWLLYKKKVNL